jgi:DNA-directed RNA polymerase subunit RPC12/RpoP
MLKKYTCKDCGVTGKENFYGYSYQCKKCWNKRTYKVNRDKLDLLITERGGACEKCGYNKSFAALQWHHSDPTKKDFGISSNRGAPMEQLREETAKCLLVCANCHAEIHAGIKS